MPEGLPRLSPVAKDLVPEERLTCLCPPAGVLPGPHLHCAQHSWCPGPSPGIPGSHLLGGVAGLRLSGPSAQKQNVLLSFCPTHRQPSPDGRASGGTSKSTPSLCLTSQTPSTGPSQLGRALPQALTWQTLPHVSWPSAQRAPATGQGHSQSAGARRWGQVLTTAWQDWVPQEATWADRQGGTYKNGGFLKNMDISQKEH